MTNQMSTEKKQEQSWLGNPPELWRIIDATRTEVDLGVSAEHPEMTLTAEQAEDYIRALIAQERADAAEEAAREARVDELAMVDKAYQWQSVVTYEGFKKWRDNRLAALTTDTTKGAKE